MTNSVARSRLPCVSVIIPVLNDQEGLTQCLHALRQQTYPTSRFEIIVVDNGSTEVSTEAGGSFPEVKWLQEHAKGSYAARNRGLQHSTGDILAFTDSDCLPAADWLEQGVRRLTDERDCGLVGGRIRFLFADRHSPSTIELYESVTYLRQQHYVDDLHFSATANLFTYRRVVDAVGAFSAGLLSGGDLEWGQRVFAAGYRQIYADEVCVWHRARRTLREILQRVRRIQGGLQQLQAMGVGNAEHRRRTILRGLVPPVRRSLEWWRSRELDGCAQRLKMIGLENLLHYVQWLETVRIRWGGEARR